MFAALDFKTMLFMSGVLAVALSLLLLAIHQRDNMLKGLKHWVFANFLLGFSIITFIQSGISVEVRALIGGLFIVYGLAMYFISIRIFELYPLKTQLIRNALISLVIANLLITFFSKNEYISILFNTSLCIAISVICAHYLLKRSRHKHYREYIFTGICFVIFAGLTFFRLYILAANNIQPVDHLTQWNLNKITFLLCMLSLLAINFGFIAMVNERMAELLEHAAGHDWLTNTLTRGHLEKSAEAQTLRTIKLKQSQAMLLMDLDNFKSINDTYGHLFGDTVLQAFADLIKDNAREIDLIGRYGGEEFCILMPNSTEAEALLLAERIRHKFESSPIALNGEPISCTVSIGLCDSNSIKANFNTMFSAADESLYAAKNAGRNTIVAYSSLH